MEDSRDIRPDIVAVSFPFAAGVLAASFLKPSYLLPAASCLTVLTCMAVCVMSRRRCIPAVMLMMTAVGAFCYGTSALSPPQTTPARKGDFLHSAISEAGLGSSESLVTALLTGDRSSLPKEVKAAFRKSGASHILALSGLHLGIIYLLISRVLMILGNSTFSWRLRSILAVALSALYAIATGASDSIVRALIFITVNEIARHARPEGHSPVSTLCIALTVHLAVRPAAISSLGFQLSYLAMLGIILIFPRLDAFYPPASGHDPVRKLWSMMAMSTACQITTAPLVWLKFSTFPRYFLLTNVISLPLSELTMTSAALSAALSSLGICPRFLPALTDRCAELLVFCLETIASM